MRTSRFTILFLLFVMNKINAQAFITVDKNGGGNFKTIQEAINSIPDTAAQDRIIYIKNGRYDEKLYIGKHHIVLKGESRDKTIITGSIASVIYACENRGDRYSGVVNLDGDDITLSDLTIENTYGLTAPDSVVVNCVNRLTKQAEKVVVQKSAHQFALRSFKSTRLKVINCIIRAWGADTVSPWNDETGMYYFKDCLLEGGTDFYCPRGQAYAENCTFVVTAPTAAAIWHDGNKGRQMKSVWVNCHFESALQYRLGRYHHEANFYLINCTFDQNMMDLPIYKAATAKPMFWDSHAYYYNCHRQEKDFDWYKDNLSTAPGSPAAADITPAWTFDGKWDPIKYAPARN